MTPGRCAISTAVVSFCRITECGSVERLLYTYRSHSSCVEQIPNGHSRMSPVSRFGRRRLNWIVYATGSAYVQVTVSATWAVCSGNTGTAAPSTLQFSGTLPKATWYSPASSSEIVTSSFAPIAPLLTPSTIRS